MRENVKRQRPSTEADCREFQCTRYKVGKQGRAKKGLQLHTKLLARLVLICVVDSYGVAGGPASPGEVLEWS